jgi:TRAP-type C4-dicarboxylate transport system substrate-binding protein
MFLLFAWLAACFLPLDARAEPTTVLRFGSISPSESPWGRAMRDWSKEVAQATQGAVRIKWYLDGIAGEDLEQYERIKRGQLDGTASAYPVCEKVAPVLRVMRLQGLFQSRNEAKEVVNHLQSTAAAQAKDNGFSYLGNSGIGQQIILTRSPVRTMDELRKVKLSRWNVDDLGIAGARAMGLQIVPIDLLAEIGRAYDEGRVDGFITFVVPALIFQQSARAKYLLDLRGSYQWGCLVMTSKAMNRLPIEHQRILQASGARLAVRVEEESRKLEEELMGRIFQEQGLKILPISTSFRAEFFAAAQASRDQVGEKHFPKALLDRVLRILADFRAQHSKQ